MSRSRRGSRGWRERQEKDPFVRKARQSGWRSRAVFKLEEILEKENLLRPGLVCVDLGAAPGGWSQFLAERLKGDLQVVAIDILPMDPLPGVEFIRGDFTDDSVLDAVKQKLGQRRADLVMSDMAPNITGNRAVDQPRAMYLAELALDCARDVLKKDGTFVCKLFQGSGSEDLVRDARAAFGRVRLMKPAASRPASREVYLVARNYQL